MSFTIRPFADADYPALCIIIADVFDQVFTPDSLRDEEARRDPKCRHEAWVAEVDGQVVAFADFNQWIGAYHPRKFGVMVAVLPAYRRRGIGGALYNRLREALAPTDAISLSCDAKESRAESIGFLERRGFTEKMRSWESRLDLTTFDPGAFVETVAAAGARGYEFRPLTAVRDLPDYDQQIYAMLSVARRDVPTVQAQTEIPFEQWVKSLSRPQLFPEGYWIAFKAGQMVGLSTIWTTDDEGMLETGVTAVLREHRGAGVARALKIKALSAAKARGYRMIKTWNATTNAPMLAINGWLGFVRQPAWIAFVLQLHPED